MDPTQDLSRNTVKDLLSHLSEPIVFKNVLCTVKGSNSWNLLNSTLEEFAQKCGDMSLRFRIGRNEITDKPQWDIHTQTAHMTMEEFLHRAAQPEHSDKWFYFDYKHMDDWFKSKPEIYNAFNWSLFGLNYSGDNSTMWIGSKGAHTNVHQDTYGCNLVAQTHGRKLWVLFSPDCTQSMQATRTPHEESTIYSRYNFFAPSKKEIEAIKSMPGRVKIITLEPTDVLFIPKGWWHYVECLDTSLSINIWLQMNNDCEDRAKETLVNLVRSTIGSGIPIPVTDEPMSTQDCLFYLQKCLKQCQVVKQKDGEVQKKRKLYWTDSNLIEELKKRYPDVIQFLPNLTSQNIDSFIKKNNVVTDVYVNAPENEVLDINNANMFVLFQSIVDGFCDPDVISKVAELLMTKYIK